LFSDLCELLVSEGLDGKILAADLYELGAMGMDTSISFFIG
jgi:hypothetical protein